MFLHNFLIWRAPVEKGEVEKTAKNIWVKVPSTDSDEKKIQANLFWTFKLQPFNVHEAKILCVH